VGEGGERGDGGNAEGGVKRVEEVDLGEHGFVGGCADHQEAVPLWKCGSRRRGTRQEPTRTKDGLEKEARKGRDEIMLRRRGKSRCRMWNEEEKTYLGRTLADQDE
jgi:hypothetical protein